ncbi:hypothetical protein [Pseudomonas sp. Q1-7]|uniref:hypothetical protein n=1 Tax=Pseudomonas sp. Q1-7 TaxID=3020843 RepID=UPI0023008E58|nr:hypothetical protein [Pseudomonas sp. Q1-7]
MNRRDFPGHTAWTETRINGDYALAFIAIQPLESMTGSKLHLIYDHAHFATRTDAHKAAEAALSKMIGVDSYGMPLFGSREY